MLRYARRWRRPKIFSRPRARIVIKRHSKPMRWFLQLPAKWQLAFGASVIGGFGIVVVGIVAIQYDLSKVEERAQESGRQQAELVSTLALDALIAEDRPALQTMVDGMRLLDSGLAKICLSNEEGEALATWSRPDGDGDTIKVTDKITYLGREFGTLRMAWDRKHFTQPILESKLRSLSLASLALLGIILGIGILLQRYIIAPLEYLEKKVKSVAHGEQLPARNTVLVARELRSLDVSLDQTATILEEKAQTEIRVIRERTRAENAEAAAKAKMDFLSLMSHEIRTPLGAMIGFAELLKSADLKSEERELLDNINNSGDFLLRIINDILDLSKIESRGIELDVSPFSPEKLCNEIEANLGQLAEAKGIALAVDCSGFEGKQLVGDRHRLKQVLMNMVGNGIKFTSKGGVVMRVEDAGSGDGPECARIRFEVSDSGIGMTDEQRSQIFDPFSQADSTITRKFGGTGLGLSVAKQLITTMGGSIGVESSPDEGSTFSFELSFPVAELSDEVEDKKPTEVTLDRGMRILVAEDEEVNRILIERIFAKMGLAVEFAKDGQECREKLAAGIDYDVIFLDLHMPHVGGMVIAKELREGVYGEAGRSVNLAIMSADVLAKEEGEECGVDAFISKPIDFEKLRQYLGSVKCGIPASIRALVVEDQPVNRLLLGKMLERIGVEVSFAQHGQECLDILSEDPVPDALFLDLRMPVMDGWTAAEKIRAGEVGSAVSTIPIAVVSAESLTNEKAAGLNIQEVLPKPVDVEKLQAFVDRVRDARSEVALAG